MYVTTVGNLYLDTMNQRMLIESSAHNYDLPVNVIRKTSPANTRQTTIPRNTDYELEDMYVVGEDKLQIYVDDILLCLGTEYNEIGEVGHESNKIQFIDWDVGKERNLEYIIIGKDYLTISINGERIAKIDNNIDIPVPAKTSDLVNDSGFVTSGGRVSEAGMADGLSHTLTIQKNGSTINTFNGTTDKTVNISVPTQTSDLSDNAKIVYSQDDTVSDIKIISESAYNALDKSSIPNGTVYLVY